MELTLAELAARLGRECEGDGEVRLSGVAELATGGPHELGFVRSEAFAAPLAGSRIGAVIAPPGLSARGKPALRSPAPSLDFARAAALLAPRVRLAPGVHPRAFVDATARLDPTASVGPLACVGARAQVGAGSTVHANAVIGADARVGEGCEIHSGAIVGERCTLGDRVILQPGCVIGGDGFGYELDERGALEKVPQLGIVVLEDDVEVGANAAIDRARLGATRIGRGTKIDNLVQVAHNVEIGAHSVLVAQVGIAGSTKLGERVFFMAQSGAAGHLEIGGGTFVGARGGVIEDVAAGSRVYGFPAVPERAWHRAGAWLQRLPELARRVRALERKLGVRGDDADGGA